VKRPKFLQAECGCVLEGPDEFGNYDLIENPECPDHGFEYRVDDPVGDDREADPPQDWKSAA